MYIVHKKITSLYILCPHLNNTFRSFLITATIFGKHYFNGLAIIVITSIYCVFYCKVALCALFLHRGAF